MKAERESESHFKTIVCTCLWYFIREVTGIYSVEYCNECRDCVVNISAAMKHGYIHLSMLSPAILKPGGYESDEEEHTMRTPSIVAAVAEICVRETLIKQSGMYIM